MAGHLENQMHRKKCRREIKAHKRENKNKQKNLRGDQRWARHRRLPWNATLPSCLCEGKKMPDTPCYEAHSSHAQRRQTRRA